MRTIRSRTERIAFAHCNAPAIVQNVARFAITGHASIAGKFYANFWTVVSLKEFLTIAAGTAAVVMSGVRVAAIGGL